MEKLKPILFIFFVCIFNLSHAQSQEEDSVWMAPKLIQIVYDWNVVCDGNEVTLKVDYSRMGHLAKVGYVWSTLEGDSVIKVKPNGEVMIWVDLYNGGVFVASDTVRLFSTKHPIIHMVDDTICAGEEARVGVVQGNLYYSWSTNNTTQYINIAPDTKASYQVRVSNYPMNFSDYKNNCYSEDTAWVEIIYDPRFEITGDTLFCKNSNFTLRLEDAIDPVWNTGVKDTLVIFNTNEDSLNVWVHASDRFGCVGTKYFTAYGFQMAGSIIPSEDTVCYGSVLSLVVNAPIMERLLWYNGSAEIQIDLKPKNTLICYVDIYAPESMGGCVVRIQDTFYVKECSRLFFANAFKLGGSTTQFGPIGQKEEYKSYYLAIYNRWGQQIFESHDFYVGWDGRYKGDWVHSGVYVYYFSESVADRKIEYRGTITVVK